MLNASSRGCDINRHAMEHKSTIAAATVSIAAALGLGAVPWRWARRAGGPRRVAHARLLRAVQQIGLLVVLGACAHRAARSPAQPAAATVANAPARSVLAYSVEIVVRDGDVSELVVHAPCGAVMCDRSPRAMNFHSGRIVGLLELAGEPTSFTIDGDGDRLASTLPVTARRPVAVVVMVAHGGSATYTHLLLVDLHADPPSMLFSEEIAKRDDEGGGFWPVGRLELVRDADYPEALALWITQVTRTGPSALVGDVTSAPARHRYVYVIDRGQYWKLD